ncbi:hypothetical protein FAES_4400 [Fibrella aestuarina BUZ 2]|uniref:AlgX/AlgJ SGNH hydrolase-like domain-containing protein n=1 Tax=Fibrella aestuarina BUZ 2 TaxID=1166018 RepID=I0KE46_9BACT|nr:hypothetical protein [Fibrella aestuarina]CCH02399.1 hypothetical protein FAES_4400 [Fibrella aestuarina BUZ 2]
MKKLYIQSIVLIFFIILFLPTVSYFLGVTPEQTMESKSNVQTTGRGGTYIKNKLRQINSYYVGNFGGRTALVYCHNVLNYFLLKQSPIPEQVLLGKDGWLFAGDQTGYVIKQHIGLFSLSADSARIIADHLLAVQQKLKQKSIKFYVLIAPDSHSIYSEKLPDLLQQNKVDKAAGYRPETPHDVLSSTMSRYPELSYIDLRDTLIQAKRLAPVYQKTDTHWNNYGALIGCAVLMDHMRLHFPYLKPIRKEDYRYTKVPGDGGDLAGLMMLRKQVREPYLYGVEPKNPLKAREVKVSSRSATGYPDRQWIGPDTTQPRLMLFGDSFTTSVAFFLPAYFGESYFVRQSTLDWKRIEAEKPDAVVVEIVERNLRALSRL